MTPDEAFKTWWGTVHNWPTNEHYARAIWHAALAYAAGEVIETAESFNDGTQATAVNRLTELADRLSPPAAP